MDSMIFSWQHIPETLNPIAFTVGFISIYWYAIFFIGGFFSSLSLAFFFVKKERSIFPERKIGDLFLTVFLGALIGGKIGYILFYNFPLFLSSPLSLLSHYDFEKHLWTGIAGMSYHGGLIGVMFALYFFARRERIPFWKSADFIALCISPAIFFGRLGNFLNGELYGRVTERPWGMFFPDVPPFSALRHPSTLYEALLEGIFIFFFLIMVRKRMPFVGSLSALYLALYASVRFTVEYLREPDQGKSLLLRDTFSFGQILSLGMLLVSIVLFFWLKQKNCVNMKRVN